jgi:hypothetical protein
MIEDVEPAVRKKCIKKINLNRDTLSYLTIKTLD